MCSDEKNLPWLTANAGLLDAACWLELCKYKWALPLLTTEASGWCWSTLPPGVSQTRWRELSKHEWALPLLTANVWKVDRYCWLELSKHEWALPLLLAVERGSLDHSCWSELGKHEWALPVLLAERAYWRARADTLPDEYVKFLDTFVGYVMFLDKCIIATPVSVVTPVVAPAPVPAPVPVVDTKKTVELFKKIQKTLHASYDLVIGCDFKDLHAKIEEDSDMACMILRVDTAKEAIAKYHALRVEASELAHAHNAECHAQNWERKAAVQLKHEEINKRRVERVLNSQEAYYESKLRMSNGL